MPSHAFVCYQLTKDNTDVILSFIAIHHSAILRTVVYSNAWIKTVFWTACNDNADYSPAIIKRSSDIQKYSFFLQRKYYLGFKSMTNNINIFLQ